MGQRIPEKEIANFQSVGEIESTRLFEFDGGIVDENKKPYVGSNGY